jgi:hypothetical protein
LTNINIRKELYEARIKMIEEEVTPFGFINNGEEEVFFTDNSGQVWETHKTDFL